MCILIFFGIYKCLQLFLPEQVIYFCATTTRSECVVFICATSTGRSKRKQTLTAKRYAFLYETRLTYINFNLFSAILSVLEGVGRKNLPRHEHYIYWFSQLYRNITALLAHGRAILLACGRSIRILFSFMLINKTSRTKCDSLNSIYYKSERFTLTTRWDQITRKSANLWLEI